MRILIVFCSLALTACMQPPTPSDMAEAERLCSFRGGVKTVARWEMGAVISAKCKDGSIIDLRRAKGDLGEDA